MKEGKRMILHAAHRAAQQTALELAAQKMWSEEGYVYPERKAALDDLVEAGFGRFFLNDFGGLLPIASGRHMSDPESDDSWHDWALFNMDEVKSYIEFHGLEDKDEVIVKHNERCPECNKSNVLLTQRGSVERPITMCYHCRSEFVARENDTLFSVCEDGSGLYAFKGAPGQVFSHCPYSRISKRGTRILVTASGGYDV